MLFVVLGASVLAARPGLTHEIPNDVTIHTLIKPENGQLRILMRLPLEAMRDVIFPTTGPGYLDVSRADQQLLDAANLWIVNDLVLYEDQTPLAGLRVAAARASIPSDRSFRSYDSALAHVLGPPLAANTGLVWQQALLDVLLEVPIRSPQSEFSITGRFERLGLRVNHLIRYLPPDGEVRSYATVGSVEQLPLDPNSYQAAGRFFSQGFLHIPDGTDHVLFLLCLVLPLRWRLGSLIGVVTAFTVAHSITLGASALGFAPTFLSFAPLVEMLIALSILYLAIENAIGVRYGANWTVAFGFGLIHGFGFSFALQNTLQFAGEHLAMSLLSFNLGVEAGQLMILAILIPVANLLFRYVVSERIGTILISVFIGHTAWHWMLERHAVWRAYDVRWTDLFDAVVLGELRWLLIALAAGAAAMVWFRRTRPPASAHESRAGGGYF
jgi:hypothetical protein